MTCGKLVEFPGNGTFSNVRCGGRGRAERGIEADIVAGAEIEREEGGSDTG